MQGMKKMGRGQMQGIQDLRRGNAAGRHDNRPKRQRTRAAQKARAISAGW